MAAIRGFNSTSAKNPRGPWTKIQDRAANPSRAKTALNVAYGPINVYTRDGFGQALAVSGKVTSMYHWVTTSSGLAINRLVFYESESSLKMRDLIGLSTQTLFSQAARGAVCAEAGNRLFIPTFTTAGIAASQMRIVNALLGGVPFDYGFAPPMTVAPSMSDTGAGQCSSGAHRFGYLLEDRTGFTGKPSPYISGVFTPTSYTVTGSNRALQMTVSGTMPTNASYLHAIMTRKDNPNRWYRVPDASVAVPGGVSWTANIPISISDEDLAARATEVTENFSYLTQDSGGSGPFSPHFAIEYGQRMVYLTEQRAYVSDIQDYQVILNPQSTLDLPGQRRMVTAMVVRGVLYILGPGWTYGIQDSGNAGRAREWGTPALISGGIGTTAIQGTCWRTGGDYAWVANKTGLYYFDGKYSDEPISFGVDPEWARINWGAPQTIQVVDDYVNHKVVVLAPLDGATEPTHMLTFDYRRGKGWRDVDFSLDNLPTSISSLAMVLDNATGLSSLWVGPAASGHIVKSEIARRNDDGSAIDSQYETGLLVNPPAGYRFTKCGGLELDVTGSGTLAVTFRGLNEVYTRALNSVTLAAAPADYPFVPADDFDQNFSVLLRTNAVSAFFDLARVTAYHLPWMSN
jgi:hypothetical protein